MPDKLVNMKQAALRDGMVLLVIVDDEGKEQTLYLQPTHMAPGDGIAYPRAAGAESSRPVMRARRRVEATGQDRNSLGDKFPALRGRLPERGE